MENKFCHQTMLKHAECPAKCLGLVMWRFIENGQGFLEHILPQKDSGFSRILHSHAWQASVSSQVKCRPQGFSARERPAS